MSDDRLKMPAERDFGFYQRRKHDKWRAVPVPEPALESTVVDTHAHVHMLPDPAWELARCAANGVTALCEICDPSEDHLDPASDIVRWQEQCSAYLESELSLAPNSDDASIALSEQESSALGSTKSSVGAFLPSVRFCSGVHPHNARLYDSSIEKKLVNLLDCPLAVGLGEVGLDYYYDLSPRDVQRRVFRRQIALAKELELPIALHLRGGDDPVADNAHREAFEILSELGFPAKGTLLHCCALAPEELKPWIDAGCYIAYGGALTFKNSEEAREGARLVPEDRLLLETDSPYMTPEPMRGAACTPAHVVFTAARLAEVRGVAPGDSRRAFLDRLNANAHELLSLL